MSTFYKLNNLQGRGPSLRCDAGSVVVVGGTLRHERFRAAALCCYGCSPLSSFPCRIPGRAGVLGKEGGTYAMLDELFCPVRRVDLERMDVPTHGVYFHLWYWKNLCFSCSNIELVSSPRCSALYALSTPHIYAFGPSPPTLPALTYIFFLDLRFNSNRDIGGR